MAASMGAVLMCGGEKGKRFVLPNSRLLLHQPLIGGVLEGPATDLSIEAAEIIRLRKRLYEIIAFHTGKPLTQIEVDCDRNKWLDAQEALEYGLADKLLERAPETPPRPPEE
jgi:ATP-dependent Clp protease protease subunit